MFLLKKFIGPLLFPHTVFLGLLVAGVLMLWFSSKRRFATILITLATAGFFLLSYPVAWRSAIEGMESKYPPLDIRQTGLSEIRWVVVLGGGGPMDARLPATSQMSTASLGRFVEGMRIIKSLPQAKLLLSGDSDALIMQKAALLMGVEPERIAIESKSRDTESQAEAMRQLLGREPFILVTSALHMPRSMALFAKQGLFPISAPADFLSKGQHPTSFPQNLLPSSKGGAAADYLFHEWIGMTWAKLRGRI
jgi:uncharacterized SAM-binding protein YcdF (DUF218 family)